MSLSRRFLIPTLTLMALTTAVTSWVSYKSSQNALNNASADHVRFISRSTAERIEEWALGCKTDLESWADLKAVHAAATAGPDDKTLHQEAAETLSGIITHFPYFDRLNLVNLSGLYTVSTDAASVGKLNIADRDYFKKAAEGQSTISEVIKSKVSGKPSIVIAAPVKENGKIVAVLTGIVNLGKFTGELINPIRILKSGYVFVYDAKGLVLAHPRETNILSLDLKTTSWGQGMLATKSGSSVFDFESSPSLVNHETCPQLGWGVASVVSIKELQEPTRKLAWTSLTLGTAGILLIMAVLLWIVRSVVNPIKHVVHNLNTNAETVSSVAAHISAESLSLAEGASQQSASVEETSASLEQISAMAKRNAQGAQTAQNLTQKACSAGEAATRDMAAMQQAMQEIKKASDQTSNIIKTIHEIAFQTNLLALNAAVEAARAGEAGAGFAVVADEVRSLAVRCASAVQETTLRIDDGIQKSNHGMEVSAAVEAQLTEMAMDVQKANQLIAEIAAASQHQSDSVQEITTAVQQIGEVTQKTAAASEESASGAEELNTQSEALKTSSVELLEIVSGKNSRTKRATTTIIAPPTPI